MLTEQSLKGFSIFSQGESGHRGPDGPPGKPGPDVSQRNTNPEKRLIFLL